ncbi:oligopeptidase B protein [Angomonas deanei]|uniref:Prolyl endopeptidase n=1 Tax=Angomonas deanei TaxID=59799 RepID=A0A7G2CJS1_9TRYP|nr:oligopeptidase B protein [Angomonas deanei]CAD2220100.1 Prolyl oligopeptidase family, putative [Angomonas deanei]|eukprot:EPY21965.1 oligopeptidase B protein [Angomonas deanei]
MSFVYSSIIQPSKDCVFHFDSKLSAEKAKMCSPEALFTQRQAEQFTPWDYMWPYSMYRDVCISEDGTEIPITICQRRDAFVQEATDFEAQPNSPKHCLIYVYGSYGEVPSMHFQLAPYMWMIRRRWTVAFAHVRGGGELPGWAEQGKGKNKMKTVQDFIACCEHMVDSGYTKPELMVAAGNSAGCVPIAAAMNMRGNTLFGNALLRSPFLDIINTMIDPDLPLSLAEREDWGDPLNNKEDLERLKLYDPYYNINNRVSYPGMFISACLDDDRVPAWNTLKYVAKLRHQRKLKDVDPASQPLITRLRNSGGHYYWGSTSNLCEEIAFLCSQLDLEGAGKILNDMDVMTHMANLTSTGAMDHDDQKKVFMKWDNWEREKIDYHVKLHNLDWEPNFRQAKAEKEPFFWVPSDKELDQKKVDEMFRAKERNMGEQAKSGAKPGNFGVPKGKNLYEEEKRKQ